MDDRDKIKNANRVNQLENLVEKHTRTERHLEQHSDIANDYQLEHAEEIQGIREKEIENLEKALIHGEAVGTEDELENLKKNYEYTKNYLAENSSEMSPDTLEKTKEKQKHREYQIKSLEENLKENKNEQQ